MNNGNKLDNIIEFLNRDVSLEEEVSKPNSNYSNTQVLSITNEQKQALLKSKNNEVLTPEEQGYLDSFYRGLEGKSEVKSDNVASEPKDLVVKDFDYNPTSSGNV